jgi:methylated-DNA-protein-cysteine methyltransferase-like protein
MFMRARPERGGYFERVWKVVRRIPKGKVATYGTVSRAAGFPGAARQVAWALRGAPRGLHLPWHRVLGAGGRILLPGEAGLEQRLRLQAEGVTFAGARVRMERHEYRIRK